MTQYVRVCHLLVEYMRQLHVKLEEYWHVNLNYKLKKYATTSKCYL